MSHLIYNCLLGLFVHVLFFTSMTLGADAPTTEKLEPEITVIGGGATADAPINMGKEVTIKVSNFHKWLEQEKEKKDLSTLVVYLNGRPIKNTTIRDMGNDQVAIRLEQTSDTKTTWSQLLGRPDLSARRLKLSIASAAGQQLPGQDMFVQTISPPWLAFYVVLLVVLLILFGWMASRSNIIRDSTTPPTSQTNYRPYSLAKLQMAVWFFLILSAFLFIWIVTGQYDSITPQVLGLMGIATGTALGAAVIDDNKNRAATNELTDMRPRCKAIEEDIKIQESKIADLKQKITATSPADPKDLDALKQMEADLVVKKSIWDQLYLKMNDAQSRMSDLNSTSFLDDLLSDANGYSFHRFQIFAWTIVLGILFVRAVWAELAMPQFNETLLALMGVSAGTYLGFKFPERPSDPSVPRPVVPPGVVPSPILPQPAAPTH